MKLKRTLLLIFFLLAGAVIGALLASVFAGVSGLSWLAFSRSVGISPASPLVLDLSVFQFSFGFSIDISVAQILCIGGAIALFNVATRKK